MQLLWNNNNKNRKEAAGCGKSSKGMLICNLRETWRNFFLDHAMGLMIMLGNEYFKESPSLNTVLIKYFYLLYEAMFI